MFKRLISFLAVFVLLFTATISVSAAEVDTDIGIMTTDELYDVETLGTVEFPSWADFNDMIDVLPTTHTTSAGITLNIDRYFVFLAKSGTYSDDTYHINVALWDSSISTVRHKTSSSYGYLYAYDNNNLDQVNIALYYFDKEDTNTWVWYDSVSSGDSTSYYTNRALYSNEAIYNKDTTTLITVNKGVQPYYDSFLTSSGDPDYTTGDTTTGGGTGGSFTQAEKTKLFSWLEKIWNAINTLASSIGSYFSDLGNHLGSKLDDIYNALVDGSEGGTTGRNLFDAIADIVDSIASIPGEIAKEISNVIDSITTMASDIVSAITTMADNIVNSITTMADNIVNSITTMAENIVASITTCIENVITILTDFFSTFFDKLFSTIENVLFYLFVPSEGYFEGVLGEVNGRIEGGTTYAADGSSVSTGSILTTVKNFASELNEFLQGDFNTPPNVTVNLSAAEGKYDYGTGEVSAVNFSWFARYRKYTDPFLSALMWIGFMWLLVRRLPDILNAVGMTTDGGIVAMETAYSNRERERAAESRNSYETYKENRKRNEQYDRQYKSDKRSGRL